MDVQIRIMGGTDGDLAALGEWLRGEDEFRGRIRAVHGAISETELGRTRSVRKPGQPVTRRQGIGA